MRSEKYTDKLASSIRETESVACIGLDPVPERLPPSILNNEDSLDQQILKFCKEVVEVTTPYAAAFKINTAFFEQLGSRGWEMMEELVEYTPEDKIIILDAKRGDIGNTAKSYARALFDALGADAVTVNPLMGLETLEPFVEEEWQGIYALALTSNPGADQFLKRPLSDGGTLSMAITQSLVDFQQDPLVEGAVGLVVGATQADDAKSVLELAGSAPLLIPGLGAQGGDVESWVQLLKTYQGYPLFNSSRAILYAHEDDDTGLNWQQATEMAALTFKNSLQAITTHVIESAS